MNLFVILMRQVFLAYQSALQQSGDECTCTRKRVKDMYIFIA